MAMLRASAPDGVMVTIYLMGPNRENLGTLEVDFYIDLPNFLTTPYIHNDKRYSNWASYNFTTNTLDNINPTHLEQIDNIEHYSASGYMEFVARTVSALPLSLQYGSLSSLYDNNTVLSSISNTPGTLRIGYDDEKALLFWDNSSKRLPFSAVIKWNEILDKPNVALDTDVNALQTTIENDYLAKKGGTMTGEIVIGQGDGKGIQLGTDGRINATTTTNGSTSTTCTIVGIINGNAILGHSGFNTTLRGNAARPTYNAKSLALYSDLLSLTDNQNNSFTLANPDNSRSYTWTAQNYYPTSLTWDTDTTKNITGTITLNNKSTVSVSALPEATDTSCGIITIDKQVIKGTKNFIDPINLNDKATLEYNPTTNSLDFSFI